MGLKTMAPAPGESRQGTPVDVESGDGASKAKRRAIHPRRCIEAAGPRLLAGFIAAFGLHAGAQPAARIIRTTSGADWWLPPYVKITPYSGYISAGDWSRERMQWKRFQDGRLHFAYHMSVRWREINPAEDVYDWDRLDKIFGSRTGKAEYGIVFYVKSYTNRRTKRGGKPRPDVPDWVIQEGKVKFLPNGAPAAWEPGCGYQKYFGKLLRAVGERYKDHPRLVAVDMRGFDPLYGEWCFRGSRDDCEYAEQQTGLTPETFQRWGIQYVDDFVEAFKGWENKLVWMNGEDNFIPQRLTDRDYGPASRAIWRHAYAKGCGGRDGMPTVWYRYLNEGHGCRLSDRGYLEFNDDLAPVRNGAMWYTENTEYVALGENWFGKDGKPKYGPPERNNLRFFITTMRVLQMRRNWQWVRGNVLAQINETMPDFIRWMEYEMGKTPEDSPDAWAWLREGYLRHRDNRPVKNFERWLLQRDVEPDGRTVPAEKVDISWAKINYSSGKGYEFHARRTDTTNGSSNIYFRIRRRFLSGGPHSVLLNVTYRDDPAVRWCVEYSDRDGRERSGVVASRDSGKWKTVGFEIPDWHVRGAFRGETDFRIVALGPGDVTVKLVRLIKLGQEPGSVKTNGGKR